uniref:Uncharacterized protein n=1 Tax=Leviviridae sp. TaxID=2027243 RepID=A0A514D5J5_9VIRU|nr:MAG: hypothetical protein H1Rhizo25555_000002 [Leviviridae sp.]
MLPTNLNTNEVKNSAGTEVEFSRLSTLDRSVTFAQVSETPNLPHRLKVSHLETGTGTALRRRSVARFDKTVTGASGAPRTISAYAVLDIPQGDIGALSEVANVVAELNSFLSTTGAGTTVLFDGTGYGTAALINGSL